MAAAPQQQRGVDGWREPASLNDHSTAVVNNQLYLWGGDQHGMPRVHDSAEKLQFFSSVEVFDVNTGCWEQRSIGGTPPLGVLGYSCVAVRNDLHYFGGYCGHDDCYHNGVHSLSTSTLQWRTLFPSIRKGGVPMQKHHCGMMLFTDGEEDLLYVVGGMGNSVPLSPQHRAQYGRIEFGCVYTNEQHIFSLSTNEWSSPVVTGQAPPPCSSFTLTTLEGKRAVMFGGTTPSIASGYSDDLYIVDLHGRRSVNWINIKKPVSQSIQWPVRRYAHAASHITGPVLVMSGGYGGYGGAGSTLSDVWLLDTNQWLWNKLPVSTGRYRHSVSIFHLRAHCVWIVVFGGYVYPENMADTSIIELIQDTSGQWCVERVMERETLSNNTEYQEILRAARIMETPDCEKQLEIESYKKEFRETKEEVRVLNDRLQQVHQLLEDNKQHQMETKDTLRNVLQQLTHEQDVTREKESEIQRLQKQLSCEQAEMKKKENEIQYLQQDLMFTREQAINEERESEVHKLHVQLAEKELEAHQLQQELTLEQDVSKEKESEIQELRQKLAREQRRAEESQQLIKEKVDMAVQTSAESQQNMREKEECYQRRIRMIDEKNRPLNVTGTDGVQQLPDDKADQVNHHTIPQTLPTVPQTAVAWQTPTDTSETKFQTPTTAILMTRVARKIPTMWHEVGIQLSITVPTLDAFEEQNNKQSRLYTKVFEQWRKEGKVPYTWDTIIKVLEDVGEISIATELREWLSAA